jgi:PH (Pleckstrin Homology) domain-containing protein
VNREAFRLAPPLILWWVWVVFAVANIADFAIQGASARFAIVVSAILATVTGLAYALAWRPRVIAGPDGLTIMNPFRDHHVPWPAIQAVDTGDWVRVHYALPRAAGPGSGPSTSAASRAILCWALYVSARTKRRITRVSQAPGYGASSRMPEEAKYLASLPPAKAIAVRLDARAARERARAGQAAAPDAAATTGAGSAVTARWAWPPAAAVALPALALVIVAIVV